MPNDADRKLNALWKKNQKTYLKQLKSEIRFNEEAAAIHLKMGAASTAMLILYERTLKDN